MKKAILGLAGLVLFACMMYILYPSIMRFLHLDQTSARPPSLTSQTPIDDKKKPELPPRTGHELSATVNTTPPEPPGTKDVPDAVAQFLSSAREAEDRGDVVAARQTEGRSRASSRSRARSCLVNSTRCLCRASAYCRSASSNSRSLCSHCPSSVRATTRLAL